jgi:hypothetical protein
MDNIPPWQDLLQEYGQGPDRLSQVVSPLSEDQLDSAPDDENWTIRQIIHHVVDGDDIWTWFVKQALGGKGRPFDLSWYWDLAQDDWAENWHYASRPIGPSLALLKTNREHVLSLLSTVPKPWKYTLELPFPGVESEEWSIQDALWMNTIHLQGHLKDIQDILTESS